MQACYFINPYPAKLKYSTSIRPDLHWMGFRGQKLLITHRRVWSKMRLHVCALESMEQDQIEPMCRLILIYTLRKFSPWSQTAGKGLSHFQAKTKSRFSHY